jgi:hypothetical protein
LAIRIGNQMGVTGKTAVHDKDWRSRSGGLGRVGKTGWTNQTGIRSRRFESRQGRPAGGAPLEWLIS